MINIIKRAAMLAVAVIATVTVSAQSHPMSIGGSVIYSTGDDYTALGWQVKYGIGITDAIRAEGSFSSFYMSEEHLWDLSINLHYLFPVTNKATFYPLAGVSMMGYDGDWDSYDDYASAEYGDSELGFNLGAGMDYYFTKSFGLNTEFKYRLGEIYHRPMLSLGLFYKF